MKLSSLLRTAAAALAAICSCTNSLEPQAKQSAAGPRTISLQATAQDSEPDTKAVINDDGSFQWQESDIISVFSSSGAYYDLPLTEIHTTADSKKATFTGEFDGTLEGFAVFPSNTKVDTTTASKVYVKYPESYGINNTLENWGILYEKQYVRTPMIAKCENEMQFHHVGGLLRITLQGVPEGTSYLAVETDCPISGVFKVENINMTEGINWLVMTTPKECTPVKFIFSKQLESPTSLTINAPVPEGIYSKIKVSAYNPNHIWLASAESKITRKVDKGHGKKFTMKMGDIPGTFAGLVIAPGDLTRTGDDNVAILSSWEDSANQTGMEARFFTWKSLWSNYLKNDRYGLIYDSGIAVTGTIDLPEEEGGENYTWRIPTSTEVLRIFSSLRTGSTVNNIPGYRWATVILSEPNYPTVTLVFPDGVDMKLSYTLPYYNDPSKTNVPVTKSQLNEYLAAGCVAFFHSGTLTKNNNQDNYVGFNMNMRFWTSTSVVTDDNKQYAYWGGLSWDTSNQRYYVDNNSVDKETYAFPVRLVREPN